MHHAYSCGCLPLPLQIDSDHKFFNRIREKDYLIEWLKGPPDEILVVVGPNNAGTTAFLKEMLVNHPEQVGLAAPALFLDARNSSVTSASSLKDSLLTRGSAYESMLRS